MHFLQFPGKASCISSSCLPSVIHFLSSKHGKIYNLAFTHIQTRWLSKTIQALVFVLRKNTQLWSCSIETQPEMVSLLECKGKCTYSGIMPLLTLTGPTVTRGEKMKISYLSAQYPWCCTTIKYSAVSKFTARPDRPSWNWLKNASGVSCSFRLASCHNTCVQ